MTDYFNNENAREVYTLAELSGVLKETIQRQFKRPVWIKAEISEWKPGQRGHYYLQLVDKRYGIIEAQMRAMIWASNASRIIPYFEQTTSSRIGKGMTILFQGSVSFHPVYGLAVQILYIDPAFTLGEMAQEREATIARLRKEGFWDMNRELAVPLVPQRLAVIAAPGSKGLNDFNKTLKTFCPEVHFNITLFSSIMQGENAAADIIRNIRIIEDQHEDYDALVVIRGGGAELDLKCFDEYELCAIMAQVSLPVITGIGHTDDETICDMIASVHRKTPTDSAAYICDLINNFTARINSAEDYILSKAGALITGTKENLFQLNKRIERAVKNELRYQDSLVTQLSDTVRTSAYGMIKESRKEIHYTSAVIHQLSNSLIRRQKDFLEHANAGIKSSASGILNTAKTKINTTEKMVRILHPENVLKRGYSISILNGKAVTDSNEITPGDEIQTILYNGELTSVITKKQDKRNG